MNFWKSISGMLQVELTSANPEESFLAANEQGIAFFRMEQISGLTTRLYISRANHRRLQKLCEKRGDTLRICGRKGLYWNIKALIYRPMLLIGLSLMMILLFYFPTRVLFVRVEGNSAIPDRQIIAAAEACGIYFGASRREVRSERMKNAILSALPQLQWAGVNTRGCVAVISVRERTEPEVTEQENVVSSIVADRDGVILSCTIVEGNGLCSVGQAVKEGQILISGYTDCGISIQATRAEGEIYAQTERKITVTTPTECMQRIDVGDEKKKISLLIGKKRINLRKDSGIWDASCDRMYEEYYITLPGGFQLPVGWSIETCTSYQVTAAEIPQTDAEKALSDYGKYYLSQQMVAGNIVSSLESASASDGTLQLEADHVCTEMIGRVRQEQIGEENGKSD